MKIHALHLLEWITFTSIFLRIVKGWENAENGVHQNYEFRYYVRDESTGDIKSQEERKVGGEVVGHYTVGEPNGDLRVVSYNANDGGFTADVKYEEGGSPYSKTAQQKEVKSRAEFHWLPAQSEASISGADSAASEETKKEETKMDESEKKPEEPKPEDAPSIEVVDEKNAEQASTVSSSSSESSASSSSDSQSSSSSDSSSSSSASGETVTSAEASASEESKSEASASSESGGEKKEPEMTSHEENAPKEDAPKDSEMPPPHPVTKTPLEFPEVLDSYLPLDKPTGVPYFSIVAPQREKEPQSQPTIIYASQNFYNPMQWFGQNGQQHPSSDPTQGSNRGYNYLVVSRLQ